MKVRANGIDIEVEDSGGTGLAVLLVMGLGMQLVAWPPALVDGLVAAGYRVIRHDNRDIGLSQHFDHHGTPNMLMAVLRHKLGLAVRAPYSLHDMAADAIGVLDALGLERAHVVGVSMGGMIAQRMAIAAPDRLISLTSVMSTSGARGLPQARGDVTRALLARPRSAARDDVLAHYVRFFHLIGSPAWPQDDAELRARILRGLERSEHPVGTLRQMLAIAADRHRARDLAQVRTPTLVMHGKADPLVPYACGVDTARRIAGARLIGLEGWGHDLPAGVVPQLLGALSGHFASAEQAMTSASAPAGDGTWSRP